MSEIKVHNSSGVYGNGFTKKDGFYIDAKNLIDIILTPVIAQHIVSDSRLEAVLSAITENLERFIEKNGSE